MATNETVLQSQRCKKSNQNQLHCIFQCNENVLKAFKNILGSLLKRKYKIVFADDMINYIEKQSKSSSKLIILKSSLRLLVTTLTHTHTIMVFLSQLNQLEIIKKKNYSQRNRKTMR